MSRREISSEEPQPSSPQAELQRLEEDSARRRNWKRFGPYLSERQWGTVREDYSSDGNCWAYLPHDHSRSRAYRWGEDGLLGICDRQGRLCLALALWNGRDPILKERLFGLGGPEGNHGEDVKELYYYLDSTPTHSWMQALYKYPQAEFPYQRLLAENARRGRSDPEFELLDTGIFEGSRYFDVLAEYAKSSPGDVLARVTLTNRGPDPAPVWLLPTLWFRNTWAWGRKGEGYWPKPRIERTLGGGLLATHVSLGAYRFEAEPPEGRDTPEWLFTENETNMERLFGTASGTPHVKDSFHDYLIHGKTDKVNPNSTGTKAAALYRFDLAPGESRSVRLRLTDATEPLRPPFAAEFEQTWELRHREADEFYQGKPTPEADVEAQRLHRQASAGLLWSKQFYHYVVKDWLEGDPAQPKPPDARARGRNRDWGHLYNRDVISMPDKWEYPWYAAWDLAFHTIPLAPLDPSFAKEQLLLFLREWYMHPNGQLPAYEFALGDVNPPVHAWAAWRVYKMTGRRGARDHSFLARVFQKLLLNFTWWVNRKDVEGHNLFSGGFLGLDNIGVFDRNAPLPTGGHLEQADGTAWMAFYCATMLSMALELARVSPEYEDLASKFFDHFVSITDAMNTLGGTGLWDETDGFYYDQIHTEHKQIPLRIRSIVGLIPLVAVEVLEEDSLERLKGFSKRMHWFLDNRHDLARHIAYLEEGTGRRHTRRLLAIPSHDRLERVLRYLLDEDEFLSPYGIRSLSKVHEKKPFVLRVDGVEHRVEYNPGESATVMFGGNSNWRGPIWFPINFLLIEALERYYHFYGNALLVECPSRSGHMMNLKQAADEISRRLVRLFLPDARGQRPCHGGERRYAEDPAFRDLLLFHEYFHAETGRGLGAAHQTGWTALVARLIR